MALPASIYSVRTMNNERKLEFWNVNEMPLEKCTEMAHILIK